MLHEYIVAAHKTAVSKGWYDSSRTFGDMIALMHSELSEALEEYRNGREVTKIYYDDYGKPQGVPVELADVLIRIFDACGYYGIDLELALKVKMQYNRMRPVRHGGKRL